MINIRGEKHKFYRPNAIIAGTFTLEFFEKQFKFKKTGKAYFKSIVQADSEHIFKGLWYLAFSVKMRDELERAAQDRQRRYLMEQRVPIH